MKIHEDGSYELTDAETVVKEWHCSLLDAGYSHAAADEAILLRTPTNGMAWKVLADMDLRKHLHGIRIWGPLAKNDHVPADEPLPRIFLLGKAGQRTGEMNVRRLGPDLYVVKATQYDAIEHLVTTQEVKDADWLEFGRHECRTGTEADLDFKAVVGAPGVGQAWECRECHAPWTRIGYIFFRSDVDDAPQELTISDVI